MTSLLAVFTIYSGGEAEGAGPPPVAYSHFPVVSTLQCTSLGLGRQGGEGGGRSGWSCKTGREGLVPDKHC